MRITSLALVVLTAPLPLAYSADFSKNAIGTTGSQLLAIDAGARGIAMGGALSAATSDALSMYWNPAGLTQVQTRSGSFMHNQYVEDITFDYLAYAQRLNEASVAAGSVRYMDGGSIPSTDINGNSLGEFHPRSYSFEGGYALNVVDMGDFERDIAFGVAGRMIHSDLVKHANGFAGDIGVQSHYWEADRPHHFAFVAQNFGQGQKFDAVRDTLPFRMKAGGAVQFTRKLLLTGDLIMPIYNAFSGAVGAEYAIETSAEMKLFLRGGLNTQPWTNGPDGLRGVSLGFGGALKSFAVDYAFVPQGVLGHTHRVSVSFTPQAKAAKRYRKR